MAVAMVFKIKNKTTEFGRVTFLAKARSSGAILAFLLLLNISSTNAQGFKYNGGVPSPRGHETVRIDLTSHDYDHQEQHDGVPGSVHGVKGYGHQDSNCRLPDSWKGKWFQSGVQQPITITSKSIELKGTCYERSDDKFLFIEPANNNCRRCIVINERHPNVLQYKESLYCEENKESLETLCRESIPGDAQLFSLFRLDSAPVDCPFKGAPFTFTYNRGHGECRNPVSHVDSCTDSTRLLFRFQACPDVQKTESTAEELQCYASWKEGSQHYLIGRMTNHLSVAGLEDSYRCFVYEKIGGKHGGAVEYKIAQSGDATCTGVQSPTDGARTLILTKAEPPAAKCKFPTWFSSSHWYTLDGKMLVKANHKNGSVHVSDDSGRRHNNSILSTIGYPTSASMQFERGTGSFITGGSRISCQSMMEFNGNHVAITAHHIVGCKSKTVCMHMYRRDRHVIEIQTKEVTGAEEFDCGNSKAMMGMSSAPPYVTLVSSEAQHRRCPHVGKYLATGITQDGRVVRDTCNSFGLQGGLNNFNTLIVGCGEKATMEFLSNCPNQEQPTTFACHGNWEENGSGFVIATPLGRSSSAVRRYCFVYRSSSENGLTVYSSSESCRRSNHPGGESPWAFNLTIEGKCAEAVTAGGSRVDSMSVIPTISALALLVFFNLAWLVNPIGSDAQSGCIPVRRKSHLDQR